MTESVVPNNSASENAQIPGTIGTSAVAEHKGDSFNGTSIITIGRVDFQVVLLSLYLYQSQHCGPSHRVIIL